FEGPDVFSWQVLTEMPSEHYHPGEGNRLKVRVEKDGLKCYVNDELVIESTDNGLTRGRGGLAKFRNTGAEFRLFWTAKEVAASHPDSAAIAKLHEQIEKLPRLAQADDESLRSLASATTDNARAALLARAGELELRAVELKRMAADLRTSTITAELVRL